MACPGSLCHLIKILMNKFLNCCKKFFKWKVDKASVHVEHSTQTLPRNFYPRQKRRRISTGVKTGVFSTSCTCHQKNVVIKLSKRRERSRVIPKGTKVYTSSL